MKLTSGSGATLQLQPLLLVSVAAAAAPLSRLYWLVLEASWNSSILGGKNTVYSTVFLTCLHVKGNFEFLSVTQTQQISKVWSFRTPVMTRSFRCVAVLKIHGICSGNYHLNIFVFIVNLKNLLNFFFFFFWRRCSPNKSQNTGKELPGPAGNLFKFVFLNNLYNLILYKLENKVKIEVKCI